VAGIKILRVKNVVAQKIAWTLVLLAALAMPMMMRWQVWQPRAAVVVPMHRLMAEAAPTPEISTNIALFPSVVEVARPAKQSEIPNWKSFVVPVYLLIAGILLLRIAIGLALSSRLWSRAQPASVLLESESFGAHQR